MSLQTWGVLVFDIKHRKDCEPRVQDEENGSIFQESWHIEYHLRYYVYGSGRAGTIDFFHVVNAESWRLGIGNDHEKKPWVPCQWISLSALPRWGLMSLPGFEMACWILTSFRNFLISAPARVGHRSIRCPLAPQPKYLLIRGICAAACPPMILSHGYQ